IHAYDAYMSQYLSEALSWMGTYGVPVILLSATLPKAKRAEFVQSYLKGAGLKKREIDLNGANLDTDAYPLLTYTDGNAVRQTTEFPAERPKKVSIKTCSEEDLFQLIGELIQSGGILGIIVNTVRRAQDITVECKKLFPNIPVELLHANFIATDRIDKENHLTQMIGKDAVRPERAIIIGTQVIEQSLDIDFDVLITDLCPVDLLLQRIGRLHRHDIKRPKEHQTPTTYVLGKNADMKFEHGSELIYGACLLARTQYFLKDEIRIPDDVSPLVQKVYNISNVTMNLPPGLNAQYCKWEDDFINQEMNQKQKAEAYRIDNPRTRICPEKNNLIGWLNTPDVSATDEESYAKVRDIDETIEVIAVRRCGEGYCLFSDNLKDAHDISSSINDPLIAKKIATQSLRISSGMIRMAGGLSHVIRLLEDYNRRNLPVWQTQPWLKGALGIIFDEKGEFQLVDDGPVLRYSSEYGLRVEKKEEYE
ncbi:MAG: CRISPR-associated helicase Cas3', partial [Lachnospiraceae bacterium]|nr:CRISPR-associated helicase Cas3' [Lachnospiraceae bacterium]